MTYVFQLLLSVLRLSTTYAIVSLNLQFVCDHNPEKKKVRSY